MTQSNAKTLLALLLVALLSLACSFSVSTANFGETYLARDPDGNDRATRFSPTDAVYVIADVRNVPSGTRVKAVWIAEQAEGVSPNYKIDETELNMEQSGKATFSFSGIVWPTGSYKVELYINDELKQTLNFQVVE